MRRRLSALPLLILLSLTPSSAGLHADARAADGAERVQARAQWTDETVDLAGLFDAVVEAVNRNFYSDAVLKRHNWTERAQAARQSVLTAPTVDDAVRQINGLLAELETSHTALYTPDDYQYYVLIDILDSPVIRSPAMSDLRRRRFWGSGPYFPGIGIFTREVGRQSFVDGVLEGSPAANIGLTFGDEILSVDGRPYSPIAAFRGKIGTSAELMVRRAASAEPERLTAMVVALQPVAAFSEATEASARIIERNGKRLGYVHVWALAESTSFAKAVRRLDSKTVTAERLALGGIPLSPAGRDATAASAADAKPIDFLVVDVRGRVGGNIGVAAQLLQFLDGGSYWGGSRTVGRGGGGIASAQKPSFRGRSALLIDERTRSAGEIMAYGYKRNAFGPLLGTTTAGAVLSGSLYPMPGDTLLYLAALAHEVDGQSLEGIGVAPDYRVEQPLPYAHGADPVLEAAVSLLAGAGAN